MCSSDLGDAGQNISKFASSSTEASKISTSLPYISYIDLGQWLQSMYEHSLEAIDTFLKSLGVIAKMLDSSPSDFLLFCQNSSKFSDIFCCDGYRICGAAKLLTALGYGNFSTVVQYDLFAQAIAYINNFSDWSLSEFKDSDYVLRFTFESPNIYNSLIVIVDRVYLIPFGF